MRRATSIVTAAFVMVSGAAIVAQSRPDFTGKWTFVPARSVTQARGANAVKSAPPFGTEFTAKQDAAGLTIQTAQSPGGTTYRFDGSELKNTKTSAPGQPATQSVATASWDGKKLVIATTTTMTMAGQAHTTKSIKTLSLEADGTLVVETAGTMDGIAAPVLRSVYSKG
jgi:hypothetical protein